MISLREFRRIDIQMRAQEDAYRARCARVDRLRGFLRDNVARSQPLYPGDFEHTHHSNENDEAFAHRHMQRAVAAADYACHRLQPIGVGVYAVLADRKNGYAIHEIIADYEATYRILWRHPQQTPRRTGPHWHDVDAAHGLAASDEEDRNLTENVEIYDEILPWLELMHPGKWVVIRKGAFWRAFPSFKEACTARNVEFPDEVGILIRCVANVQTGMR